ncbi:MAG: sugar ABC transporter permease [Nocardioides sp.]|uniref:carbohydrate ABC transporter permease n=1 Tax=Nocardioides sp. TaxID=35761 RepID=UPI0039E66EA7
MLIVVPTLLAVLLSLSSWSGIGWPHWVGLSNWSSFLHDSAAHQSLVVTLGFTVLSWVVQTPISLALGLFIAGPQRYRVVYSVCYVIPMLLSSVGLALMWGGVLDPNLGGLAWLGDRLGLDLLSQNWFGDETLTPIVLLLIIAWQFIPMHALIYQNGRRSIPGVLYEASRIDGASPWRQFVHITMPQLRHTMATSSVLMLVTSLTYFDMIYVLTLGGPGGRTNVLAMQMYDVAFNQHRFGYASVFAVILGVLGVLVGFVIMRISGYSRFESTQEGVA